MSKNRNSSVKISMIVALCFAVPLFAACFIYYYHDNLHLAHSNRGLLVTPLVDAKHLAVQFGHGQQFKWPQTKGHWSVLYVRSQCSDNHALRTNLNRLSHMHAIMGKDALRIKTVLVMPARCLVHKISQHYAQRYTDFKFGTLAQKPWQHLQARLGHKQGFYLMDPLQNIMMYYPLNTATVNVYQDLAQLLKVSQIG